MAPLSRTPTNSVSSATNMKNGGYTNNNNNDGNNHINNNNIVVVNPSLGHNRRMLLLYCGALILTGMYLGSSAVSTFFASPDRRHAIFLGGDPPSSSSMSLASHPQETYRRKSKPMSREEVTRLKGPNGPKFVVLVTGAAGFVGMHTALALKALGMTPVGYDNVNEYYSIELKQSRIDELERHGIAFVRGDVCDVDRLKETIHTYKITRFIHLAAQAGVRYSLDHPLEYTRNNVDCTVNILEVMVELGLKDDPLVYASSSSVYGNNIKVPFQETDRVEDPASLYAATKRSDELIAHTYFNLHNISSIGLRFFTVYGPYGRPDMAPWIFTDKISNGERIRVFNHGKSRRDFTYVDDIVQGVIHALFVNTGQPELVNLGNGRPVLLADFVRIVEERVGRKADIDEVGMQKGDVPTTYADITKARRLLGYHPSTPIEEGIARFVDWFRQHNASRYRMS